MIVICSLLAASLVVVVFVLARANQKALERLTNAHGVAEAAWVEERRELVNRVQAPNLIPRAVSQFETPDPQPDFSHLVGQVNYDGGNGD